MPNHTPRVYGFRVALLLTAAMPLAARAASAGDFPTFGLSMTPPAGSTDLPLQAPAQVAFYKLPGDNAPAILLEVQPSGGKTAQAAAEDFAAKNNTKATPADFAVGGEKAFIFTAPMAARIYTGQHVYVVNHGNYTFVFSGLRTAANDSAAPLAALLKTVAFKPAEPVTAHLADMASRPLSVFNRFTIDAPRAMRPVEKDEKAEAYGIYDYSNPGGMKNPLNLRCERVTLGEPKTFADIRDAFSRALQKQLQLPAPMVWQTVPGVPGLNVSQPQKATIPGGQGATFTTRFCVLELAPGDFVQILFTFTDKPAADVTAFSQLSDRMVKTVKVNRAATRP